MFPLAFPLACAPQPVPEPRAAEITRFGQWIWSERDEAIFRESRDAIPTLIPAIWVATLRERDGHVAHTLGHSPLGIQGQRAILVRIDDSVHPLWEERPASDIAAEIDAALVRIFALLRDNGVDPVEVQLDYDCPVRWLPTWASVLSALRAGALSGERVWVTSLVAHLRQERYGDLLRGAVDGHILQLFDTGDRPVHADEVAEIAVRAAMPYRVGLASFERQREGVPITEHVAWFSHTETICLTPWCEGLWMFPAGRPWVGSLEEGK